MNQKLNIITLDIPYPPDYGGAIDEFYTIKYLHDQGVEIYLRCFEYGSRKPNAVLEQYCKKFIIIRNRSIKDFLILNLLLLKHVIIKNY